MNGATTVHATATREPAAGDTVQARAPGPRPWARASRREPAPEQAPTGRRRVLVIAPPVLGRHLAAHYGDASAQAGAGANGSSHMPPGAIAGVAGLPAADGPPGDPYRLRDRLPPLVEDAGADAALVVAPRRRGPARAVPGCVLPGSDGRAVVVGLVQADAPDDLATWLSTTGANDQRERPAASPVVVAAMGKDLYLDLAGRWHGELVDAGIDAADLRADRTRREVLCDAIGTGPEVVLYVGHGRARGWAGYQAMRWHHIEAVTPSARCGLVLAMACSTLSRTRGVVPFGSRFVSSGRAGAYLGAVGAITNDDGRRLVDLIVTALASGRHPDIASLLTDVATDLDPDLTPVLSAFRLIGDPLQPLPQVPSPTSPDAGPVAARL